MVSDYSTASLIKAFKGLDAVISAIATFSTQEQIKIVDAAIEAGVRRFIPSEYGIDLSTPEAIAALPIVQVEAGHRQVSQVEGKCWSLLDWGRGWRILRLVFPVSRPHGVELA